MGDWMRKYLAPLVGARITKVGVVADDGGQHGETWPVLHVELADGQRLKLQICRDAEGNGAGFIHGLPSPKAGDFER